MKKIPTLIMCAMFTLILFSNHSASSQTPAFRFCSPQLKSGSDKMEGAVYVFRKVFTTKTGVELNAYVSIKSLVNGAMLQNIDDSTVGYY